MLQDSFAGAPSDSSQTHEEPPATAPAGSGGARSACCRIGKGLGIGLLLGLSIGMGIGVGFGLALGMIGMGVTQCVQLSLAVGGGLCACLSLCGGVATAIDCEES